jgi:hypothetical protein
MKRRKFLIGAGALFAGSAAATGTGAFTTMESGDRDADVKVASDSTAYVELKPTSKYAEENGDDQLRLYFNDSQAVFEGGVNPDSTYNFEDVFEIVADHGSGDTYFYLETSGFDASVDFVAGSNTAHMSEGDSLTDPNDLGQLVQPEGVPVDMVIEGTASANSAAGGEIILHAASGGNQGQL